MTMVSALRSRGAAASTSSGESVSFAPFTTMMRFWPLGSTKIGATPLEAPSAMRTYVASIPCDSKFLIVAGPNRSLPTLATMPTLAPQRRAPTAWLAPLPPNPRSNFLPKIVSPGRGNTSLNVVRSTLALPTIAMRDCLAIASPPKIPRADYIRTPSGNCNNSHQRARLSCHAIRSFVLDSRSCGDYKQPKQQGQNGAASDVVERKKWFELPDPRRSHNFMFVPHDFGIALVMMITSAICWGSWANTYKGVKNYRFELFYWDYAVGIFLISLVLAFTMGSTSNDAASFLNNVHSADNSNFLYTLAGGAVFNLANLLLVAAIDMAGLAIAFPVSIGIALVVGVVL